MRIAYLGPPGTFSHEALVNATRNDPSNPELVPLPSISDVVIAVEQQTVEAALVPIENSVEGAVTETLDTLVHEAPTTKIAGELVWPVHLCLIAADVLELSAITDVCSHPQPLGQCSGYLRDYLPNAHRVAASSTADAVLGVVNHAKDHAGAGTIAAIGTKTAAEIYSGVVLADGIEDEAGNATRFVWISRNELPNDWTGLQATGHKTSIVFAGFNDTSPGALVGILQELASRGVNLTKIESRPERTQLGHYLFFADLAGSSDDAPIGDALAAIASHVKTLRVLGSYPATAF